MGRRKITAVSVEALSYSGTTWLNLVLGSHPKAFTLGPPWRVWALKDQSFDGANLVFREQDTFWRGFDTFWNRQENFLVALAEYAEVTHIIFDNPSADFRAEVMQHPDIEVKELRYLRDGRAISASYARKNRSMQYRDTILPQGWLYHSFMQFGAKPISGKAFRYETCISAPLQFLEEAGEFIGLRYQPSAIRFWEKKHHITWGNPGTIWMLRLAAGLPDSDIEGADFYREQFRRLKQDPLHGFRDERWKSFLSMSDLFEFDMILGAKNADLGYERDSFERGVFARLAEMATAQHAEGAYAGLPPGQIETYIAGGLPKP